MIDNSVILMNLNSGTVTYDPSQAGTNGYDDLGFLRVYEPGRTSVLKYNTDGSFQDVLVSAGLEEERITVGAGIALGPDKLVYIADMATNSVKKFDLDGNFLGYFLEPGETVDTPEELVFGYDGNGEYSVYMTSLTGGGVKRYDWETGEELFHIDKAITPSNPNAITNEDGSVDLSASVLAFSPNGKLYISAIFTDNSILEYDPDTNIVREFVSQEDGAQFVPSGIDFDEQGNLYNGTFSGLLLGLPPTTIAKYDPQGNLLDPNVIDNSNGELDLSARVKFFDFDGDGEESLFTTNFTGSNILVYEGPESSQAGDFVGKFLTDSEEIPVLLVGSRLTNEIKSYFVEGTFVENFITAGSGGLSHPDGFDYGNDGNFYVASTYNGKILRYDGGTGNFIDVFVDQGEGGLLVPVGLVFDEDEQIVYVANYASSFTVPDYTPSANDSILAYDITTGDLVNSFPFPQGTEGPLGLAFDPNDSSNLIVTTLNEGVWRFDIDTGIGENFIPTGQGGLRSSGGLVFDANDDLLVTDIIFDPTDDSANRILRFDGETGEFIEVLVSNTKDNGINLPLAMKIGTQEREGELFVNGSFSNNIGVYDSITGEFIEIFVESGDNGLTGTNFGIDFGLITPISNPAGLIYASESEILVPVDIQGAPEFVTQTSFFNVSIEFGESVTGFTLEDITLENATASSLKQIDDQSYTVNIIPDGSGDITIDIFGGAVTGENDNTNYAAPTVTVDFDFKSFLEVIATDLVNPRGMAFDDNGDLYVTEAGLGAGIGVESPTVQGPTPFQTVSFGTSGAINRLDLDTLQKEVVVDNLASALFTEIVAEINLERNWSNGASSIGFDDNGDVYVTIGFGTLTELKDDLVALDVGAEDLGKLIKFEIQEDGSWLRDTSFDVDLVDYEAQNNLDGEDVVSNPYVLEVTEDAVLTLDASANTLLSIDKETGAISVVAVLPPLDVETPFGQPQSVPTALAIGSDGAYYVGEFTGVPYPETQARILRIVPGEEPEVYATGFTSINGLEFDSQGNLYVLEYSVNSLFTVPETFASAVTKISPDGSREIIVEADEGLEAANGIAIDSNDNVFLVNKSTNNINEITNNGEGQVIQIKDFNFQLSDTVIVASVNSPAIVDYQPTLANPNGDGFTDYDANGFLRVYTEGQSSILEYNPDGSFKRTLIAPGTDDENVTLASGIALGPDNLLYLNDQATNSVKKFNLDGEFVGYFLNGTTVDTPEGIVFGYDGNGEYSIYLSSLTGDGVKRYDWETGEELFHIDTALTPSNSDAVQNNEGNVDLSAALMQFGFDGHLYIGAVFSDNSILTYNPNTNEISEFISQDNGAQSIPSGIAFDSEGNLYNGTFSGPTFGSDPTTIAQYDADGNLLNANFVDNSSGELDVSSRVRLFDLNDDGEKDFYVSNYGGNSILTYDNPQGDAPGAFNGNFLADDGQISVLLVSSRETGEVKAYDEEGNFVTNFITADSAGDDIPANPDAFVITPNNDFYLSSTLSGDILKYDALNGDFIEFFVDGGNPDTDDLVAPIDMILSPSSEKLYVANFASSEDLLVPPTNNDSILVYNLTTGLLENEFFFNNGNEGPLGLTLDASGDNLYVGTFADGVWTFDTNTGIGEQLIDETEFIPGERGSIAADLLFKDDNSLLVADFGGNRILEFDISDTLNITSEVLIETIPNGLFTPTALTLNGENELFINGAFSSNVLTYDLETGAFIETFVETNEGGVDGNNFGLGFTTINPLKNPGGLIYAAESEVLIPVDISGAPESINENSFFTVNIEFGENVDGFELEDILVENGNASDLVKIEEDSYTVNITPDGNGDINVNIAGGAVLGENNNTNFASPPVSIEFIEQEVILASDMYRFRNTSYETGAYLYVAEAERDAILADSELSETFALEGDGNAAFIVSFEPNDELIAFYRLRNQENPGIYLFVGQEEYDAIFAENSLQEDKWVKEGLDNLGNDIPEFYTYGAESNQGELFNRFRNQDNGGYLFAGIEESQSILNTSSLAETFANEGAAFEAIA